MWRRLLALTFSAVGDTFCLKAEQYHSPWLLKTLWLNCLPLHLHQRVTFIALCPTFTMVPVLAQIHPLYERTATGLFIGFLFYWWKTEHRHAQLFTSPGNPNWFHRAWEWRVTLLFARERVGWGAQQFLCPLRVHVWTWQKVLQWSCLSLWALLPNSFTLAFQRYKKYIRWVFYSVDMSLEC